MSASVPTVTAGLGMTNAIFQGERTNASQIFYAAGGNAKQDSFALNAEKKLSLKVAVKSEPGHGENVIGIVEGGDPVLKNEYVVISAHLDHIGLSAPLPDGHNVNNGADDDGSGSAGLMAMARAYAEGAAKGMRPKRSIVFLWNAGEEKGLWGSQYFAEYPPIDITQGGGGSEHRHDRAHQGAGLSRIPIRRMRWSSRARSSWSGRTSAATIWRRRSRRSTTAIRS